MKISRPLSNLHTHTCFSDGRKSVEQNIEAAIGLGFVSLGISDHSHCIHDPGTMKAGTERQYAEHIGELREKYKGRIDVFTGLELDSFSVCERELYSYIIGSVHFVKLDGEVLPVDYSPNYQDEIIHKYCGGDAMKFVREYYDELARHVEACRPDIVGHFDLFTKFATIDTDSDEYRKIAIDALYRVAEHCNRFEVNTGAMARENREYPYPAQFILEEMCKLGASVTVSSDCHDGEKLDFAFDDALSRIRKAGFTTIDRFDGTKFVKDEIV